MLALSVEEARLIPVVGATAQLDVLDGGLAAHGIRDDVVELEEATLLAPPAVLADEGARLGRGRSVVANFFLSRSATRSVRARSTIAAVSPLGTACRSRSCARRSFAHVSALAVNRTS
jgi:hypothetical protein